MKNLVDDVQCSQTVRELRWPDGVVTCPRCGHDQHSFIKTRLLWYCKGCKKQFTAKVGTIFEDSPIGLDKWLPAIWLLVNAKNGISSYELHRALGVTQKTAWFMLHRIRLAMQTKTFAKMSGSVEMESGGQKVVLPAGKTVVLYAPTWRDDQHEAGVGYTLRLGVDPKKAGGSGCGGDIGTHALIQEGVLFHRLGLAVALLPDAPVFLLHGSDRVLVGGIDRREQRDRSEVTLAKVALHFVRGGDSMEQRFPNVGGENAKPQADDQREAEVQRHVRRARKQRDVSQRQDAGVGLLASFRREQFLVAV